MKKLLILAVVAGAVATSCRKERTCECSIVSTFTPANGGAATTTNYTQKTTKDKQKAKEFRYSEGCYSTTETQTTTTPTISAGTTVDTRTCEMK
jgi:hypothetical protein